MPHNLTKTKHKPRLDFIYFHFDWKGILETWKVLQIRPSCRYCNEVKMNEPGKHTVCKINSKHLDSCKKHTNMHRLAVKLKMIVSCSEGCDFGTCYASFNLPYTPTIERWAMLSIKSLIICKNGGFKLAATCVLKCCGACTRTNAWSTSHAVSRSQPSYFPTSPIKLDCF